jgi:hypothetical protein
VSAGVDDQVGVAAVASAVAYTLPSPATATQRPEAAHEIAVKGCPAAFSSRGDCQLLVGVVVTSTWPTLSTAAQKEVVGHDTPVRW